MIEGLIGRPGSGKTYELTRRILAAADRDRLVFANYVVEHPNVFYFTPEQLLDLPPALVVIDEAHLWFPARGALQLPMSWLAGMSQTRKAGWDLLWSAQHESRVDRVVRDVTNWMHLANAWLSWDGHPMFFSYRTYEPENFRKEKKVMGRGFHFFSGRVSAAYNTLGRIEQAAHTIRKDDAYRKPSGAVS
jgi:zona occludens toxin (predicted ATPase)